MKYLSVTIYLSPTSLVPYVYWCCSDYGWQYDDVTNILRISFGPQALVTDRNKFISILKKESLDNFKLPGKKITSFKRNVLVEKFIGQNQTSIFSKQKPIRNNKAQIGLT